MICDAHIHVGPFHHLRRGEWRLCRYTPREVCHALKGAGVAHFIFSSLAAQRGVPYHAIAREARSVRRRFGPGAHPFYWLTAAYYREDPTLARLAEGPWEGIKLHGLETPWATAYPEELEHILTVAEARNLPVQIHCGEDPTVRPAVWLPFVLRHPGVRCDFAHLRPLEETLEALRRCPNLFVDSAFASVDTALQVCAAGFANRLLFGTDFPIQASYRPQALRKLYASQLRPEAKRLAAHCPCQETFCRFLRGPTP